MWDKPWFKGVGRHGYLTKEKKRSFYLNIFGTPESPGLGALGVRERSRDLGQAAHEITFTDAQMPSTICTHLATDYSGIATHGARV
jgi:hypothetical protein